MSSPVAKTAKSAKARKKDPKTAAKKDQPKRSIFWWIGVGPVLFARWGLRIAITFMIAMGLLTLGYTVINPPTTPYMLLEGQRLDNVRQEWRAFEEISPHVPRAIIAAEDANFCNHWGFDMNAIRDALEDGSGRGASTISQQTVKNVFLWHGRSWLRKALEATLTPVVEAAWTKRRILEIYMNVAEFDEGIFGIAAASKWYFGVDAKDLSPLQAAQLAVVLPNPKDRSAKRPTAFLQKRARRVLDGAATIRADGRSACIEG
ncbi:MAG: monofunctional biosynthetic peptidoglycan transglycosylase [Litoreibacter sp.]|nr:monofunctional biosynthetic peptidoglycan transglycosylase [Litoreibacter sp.]